MTQTNDPPLISSLELIPDAAEKADLDAPNTSGGKLVIGQAPNITITETTVVADAAERLALDVQEGDVAIQQNVSSSFIFTGGDNISTNWETLDFDAVGAITGKDINPRDITPRNITATGNISLQNLTVAGTINGADTSAAAAGEALTSDGSGGFNFASVGGIETAPTFGNLPSANPPQIGYVQNEDEYYVSKDSIGSFDLSQLTKVDSMGFGGNQVQSVRISNDGTILNALSRVETMRQWILSTPFDISSRNFDTQINVNSDGRGDHNFSPDGSVMYVAAQDRLVQNDLGTPFDITTIQNTASDSSGDTLDGFATNNDGTKGFIIDRSQQRIEQYSLSTPFDIFSRSFQTAIPAPTGGNFSIDFSPDGKRMFTCNSTTFFQFELATGFDISTANQTLTLSGSNDIVRGLDFNQNGTVFYEAERRSNLIHQYNASVSAGWVTL